MKKKILIKIGFLFDKSNLWIFEHFKKNNIESKFKNKFNFLKSKELSKLSNCKVIFILGYTRIIKVSKLKNFQYALVVHESDLPKGKGFSPVKYQILENKDKIKVSLIECSKNFDSGDIFEQDHFFIKPIDIYEEIRKKQYLATEKIITKFLKKYPNVKKRKQRGISTFYKKLTYKDDKIDPKKSIITQFNLLRSTDYNKFPNYFYYKGQKFYIKIYK